MLKMPRIYLDNCCYSRPFDPPANPTIVFESAAKILIQTLIINQKIILVNSFVVHEETSAIINKENRKLILSFLDNAKVYIAKDKLDDVLKVAYDVEKTGVKYMDASHIACAIISCCDYFITTDKRLLKYKTDKIKIMNPVAFILIWEEDDYDSK